ncbi:MAG: HlyD family type I secretion periplasmic adaptor subunit [Cohaesibacter sp.]|nr:HlyD family type I secretion periplasmic adaptor subunit [Cohaesibacter sp.]
MKKWFKSKEEELDSKSLSLPLALELEHPPQLFSYVITGSFLFLIGFIGWSFLTSVLEVTHATGQIQPTASVQTIQHLEGGYIDQLLVREGDRVEKGQPLVRLRSTATQSDRDRLQVRAASLRMSIANLDALSKNQDQPIYGDDLTNYPKLIKNSFSFFTSEKARMEREEAKLSSQVARRRAELATAKAEKRSAAKRLEIAKEQHKILQGLRRQEYASRRSVLEAAAALEEARSRFFALDGRIAAAKEQISEAEIQLEEQRAASKAQYAKERQKSQVELSELDQILTKEQDRVQSLDLIAPTSGLVQELAFKTIGAVVRSGEVIARIVPDDRNIIAEVRVQPKDIGHIRQGADAKVTVSTFDPFVFGTLEGEVKTISATSFEDERGEPYFKIQIALDDNNLLREGDNYPVLPGMVVTADILTGEKSLARYLLKPVFRSLDQAFTER